MQLEEGNTAAVSRVVEHMLEIAIAAARDFSVYQLQTEQFAVKVVCRSEVTTGEGNVMDTGRGQSRYSMKRMETKVDDSMPGLLHCVQAFRAVRQARKFLGCGIRSCGTANFVCIRGNSS